MSSAEDRESSPKLKVIFNCKYFPFHRDYCVDIAAEVTRRGGESIIIDKEVYFDDADFTILPDEACQRLGGVGVWTNHALAVLPENDFYTTDKFEEQLKRNADHLFIHSPQWESTWENLDIPMHVVGMPKLDSLFDAEREEDVIFYAPTGAWKTDWCSEPLVDIARLEKFGEVLFNRHPSQKKKGTADREKFDTQGALRRASIVISDYSSVGLEAIVLGIPTILVNSRKQRLTDFKKDDHISRLARKGALCVHDQAGIEEAIQKYKDDPSLLADVRKVLGEKLCSYQGNAAARTVDVLELLKARSQLRSTDIEPDIP